MNAPRTVVVTGASSGLGLEVARQLAAGGDTVVAGVRTPEHTEILGPEAADAGIEVEVIDVADDASVERGFAAVAARHGAIDVLVANAGAGSSGTLEELTMGSIRATMEVNFFGVVRATKAVLPNMRQRGAGRLVAVSSVGGVLGQPFTDAYCAAKFAVEGLYESLHPVAARFGVHVSIVEPGAVATDFHRKSRSTERDPLDGDPYGALRGRHEAVVGGDGARRQAVTDAAQVVVDVVNAGSPALRYQTSSFTRRLLGMKLTDLDGSIVTGFTGRWLDPQD